MTVSEMIAKYGIRLHGERQLLIQNYVPGGNKLSQAAKDQIVAAKPEILAELLRRKAEAKAAEKAEIEAIRAGKTTIKAHYHDGEYLSGYEVYGKEAQMLNEIGLAHYIDGWGYRIPDVAVKALGIEFILPAAIEYTRPAKQNADAKLSQQLAERAAKYQQARETGEPVAIQRYTAECNDPGEECSLDIVTVYAMPDGSAKEVRRHTW